MRFKVYLLRILLVISMLLCWGNISALTISGNCTANESGVVYNGRYTSSSKYGYTISDVTAKAYQGAQHCWVKGYVYFSSPGRNGKVGELLDFSDPSIKSIWIPGMDSSAALFRNIKFSDNLEILVLGLTFEKHNLSSYLNKIPTSTKLFVPDEDIEKYPSNYNVKSINKCCLKETTEYLTSINFTIDTEFLEQIGATFVSVSYQEAELTDTDGIYEIDGLEPGQDVYFSVNIVDSFGKSREIYQRVTTRNMNINFSLASQTQSSIILSQENIDSDISTGNIVESGIRIGENDYKCYDNVVTINNLLPNTSYKMVPYVIFDKGRYEKNPIEFSTLSLCPKITFLESTQTSAKFRLSYIKGDAQISGIIFNWQDVSVSDFNDDGSYEILLSDIYFEGQNSANLYITACNSSGESRTESASVNYSLQSLGINISKEISPSCIKATGTYSQGDAEITRVKISLASIEIESSNLFVKGLEPNTKYELKYTLYGPIIGTVTKTETVTIHQISINQPRVLSPTTNTAQVLAVTNLSDNETSVGFQWRKYNAPETLPSSEGLSIVYNGEVQGTINGLQSSSFYNVRAFYKSDNDNYYFGEWVTFDPSDVSWLDPTVHTFNPDNITTNSAQLRGYVLFGSSDIKSQGFEYWNTNKPNNIRRVNTSIPYSESSKQTILSSGQMMIAELSLLQSGTNYMVRTFVTTDEGTFYGEEIEFTTEGIAGIHDIENEANEIIPVAFYNLSGNKSDVPFKGVNIVLMNDGSTRKIVFK